MKDENFEKELAEALAFRHKLNEDRRPSPGIWYYIYLAPEWKRLAFRYIEYPKVPDHPTAWQEYVVPALTTHYKLTPEQARQLEDLPYAMPRGRVDLTANQPNDPISNKWLMSFGNDFPAGLDVETEKGRLINDFNLANFACRDMVIFTVHEHEKMTLKHKDAIQKIIGPVPY